MPYAGLSARYFAEFVVLAVWIASSCVRAAPAGEVGNFPEAIAAIKPSIVAVGTYQATRSPGFQFTGTGFAIGDGTLVATNSHIVATILNAEKLEFVAIAVPLANGDATIREAAVIARDLEHDLVLLRIKGAPLSAAVLGNSDAVREGDLFGFIGFPLGTVLGLHQTTHRAMVSTITPIVLPQANSRQLQDLVIKRLRGDRFNIFQLDSIAYPGNSGSPLFDPATGAVVAILNMVFVKGSKEAALSQPSGIAYAIPAEYLKSLIAKVGKRTGESAAPP